MVKRFTTLLPEERDYLSLQERWQEVFAEPKKLKIGGIYKFPAFPPVMYMDRIPARKTSTIHPSKYVDVNFFIEPETVGTFLGEIQCSLMEHNMFLYNGESICINARYPVIEFFIEPLNQTKISFITKIMNWFKK